MRTTASPAAPIEQHGQPFSPLLFPSPTGPPPSFAEHTFSPGASPFEGPRPPGSAQNLTKLTNLASPSATAAPSGATPEAAPAINLMAGVQYALGVANDTRGAGAAQGSVSIAPMAAAPPTVAAPAAAGPSARRVGVIRAVAAATSTPLRLRRASHQLHPRSAAPRGA